MAPNRIVQKLRIKMYFGWQNVVIKNAGDSKKLQPSSIIALAPWAF
jgi:hypothetical protein